nr:hypothetical protein [uncultured Psychroserpens sp.]
MNKLTDIKNHIANGKTKNALESLKLLVDAEYSELNPDVTLLMSDFNRWQRQNRRGLNSDDTSIRRIDLAIIEICTEIENTTLEVPKKSSAEKHNVMSKQIGIIIDVYKNAIKRSTILGIVLLLVGLSLLLTTHFSALFEGELNKTMMSIASAVIAGISGFSFKNISDKNGSIKVFTHFKNYIESLINQEDEDYLHNTEEITKIKNLIWEVTRKTVLTTK